MSQISKQNNGSKKDFVLLRTDTKNNSPLLKQKVTALRQSILYKQKVKKLINDEKTFILKLVMTKLNKKVMELEVMQIPLQLYNESLKRAKNQYNKFIDKPIQRYEEFFEPAEKRYNNLIRKPKARYFESMKQVEEELDKNFNKIDAMDLTEEQKIKFWKHIRKDHEDSANIPKLRKHYLLSLKQAKNQFKKDMRKPDEKLEESKQTAEEHFQKDMLISNKELKNSLRKAREQLDDTAVLRLIEQLSEKFLEQAKKISDDAILQIENMPLSKEQLEKDLKQVWRYHVNYTTRLLEELHTSYTRIGESI